MTENLEIFFQEKCLIAKNCLSNTELEYYITEKFSIEKRTLLTQYVLKCLKQFGEREEFVKFCIFSILRQFRHFIKSLKKIKNVRYFNSKKIFNQCSFL